ncbi:MAG TPA: type II toxin-antitoxin system PemK/MazF family toxin [Planktothrix sp.]|jgi:mRNA-degrading endonuclease toxin of MazEF toxin-antitoxin module
MTSSPVVHLKKGDVVLVAFPISTPGGQIQSKRRPAVIVSNDHNNARLDDVLIVPLRSKDAKQEPDPFVVVVMMDSPEGQAAGLRLDSIVDCTFIATMPKTLIVSKIGRFPDETIEQIDECLRRSIDSDADGGDAPVPA